MDNLNWETIEDKLYEWFKAGTGLHEVRFENDPEPEHADAFGELAFVGLPTVSRDWIETVPTAGEDEEDPADDGIAYRVHGKRYLIIKVSCVSYSQSRSKFALQYLFKLQRRIFLPRMLDILKEADLVPANDPFSDITVPDVQIDERFFSRAEFTVRLQFAFVLDDDAEGVPPVEWFNKVEVSTFTQDEAHEPQLLNVSDEPLSENLQLDEEIIGPPPEESP